VPSLASTQFIGGVQHPLIVLNHVFSSGFDIELLFSPLDLDATEFKHILFEFLDLD
jgi:hypothetical protein